MQDFMSRDVWELREEMKRLSIYDLRAMAREVGVVSPDLYKRVKLIEEIMRVRDGSGKQVQWDMRARREKNAGSAGGMRSFTFREVRPGVFSLEGGEISGRSKA